MNTPLVKPDDDPDKPRRLRHSKWTDKNGKRWTFVHPAYASRTPEFYIEAIKNGLPLHLVPEASRTKSMWLPAVQADGMALKSIRMRYRTDELCLAAVTTSGEALQFVPYERRTIEMCRVAVGQDIAAMSYVPVSMLESL